MGKMEERLYSLPLKLRPVILISTGDGRGRLGLNPQAAEVAVGGEENSQREVRQKEHRS